MFEGEDLEDEESNEVEKRISIIEHPIYFSAQTRTSKSINAARTGNNQNP
jgi:hypothetical protein